MLEKFEQACAAFIERAFARSFPSELAPAHVARKLVATMEAHTRREGGRLVAPSSYGVCVNPDDFERLQTERAYLEREWAELLRDLAARVGAIFSGGVPAVTMLPKDGVPGGAVEIDLQARPRYALRITKGLSSGTFRLDEELLVGRAHGASIELTDPSVSRRHASIALVNGVPMLRDLGSRNGSFVNGERVRSASLRAGDELRFGNTEMVVEEAS